MARHCQEPAIQGAQLSGRFSNMLFFFLSSFIVAQKLKSVYTDAADYRKGDDGYVQFSSVCLGCVYSS
jgi:hypothetical protein